MSGLRQRLRRDERGSIGVTELALAAGLSVVVLGSTLTLYDGFADASADLTDRTEAQDIARAASSSIARDLRNLASPVPEQPDAVDRAGGNDLVFKTVDPAATNRGQNVTGTKRVRLCLSGAKLLRQQQRWTTATPPAVPSGTACPAAAWGSSEALADHLVNDAAHPVFVFDSATPSRISTVHLDLRVDTDPGEGRPAVPLATGVFLRNQNRVPTAAFTVAAGSAGLVLNGSGSSDPEGRPLHYEWFDGGTLVGTGVTYLHKVAAKSTHTIALRVSDPAGLTATAPAKVVTAP